MIFLFLYPLGLFHIFKYLPLIILATLFGSLSLLSHKKTDFSFLWNLNKKSFCFIFVMVLISIYHETCLSVFYATVIYFFFYLRSSSSSNKIFTIDSTKTKVQEVYYKAKSLKID